MKTLAWLHPSTCPSPLYKMAWIQTFPLSPWTDLSLLPSTSPQSLYPHTCPASLSHTSLTSLCSTTMLVNLYAFSRSTRTQCYSFWSSNTKSIVLFFFLAWCHTADLSLNKSFPYLHAMVYQHYPIVITTSLYISGTRKLFLHSDICPNSKTVLNNVLKKSTVSHLLSSPLTSAHLFTVTLTFY